MTPALWALIVIANGHFSVTPGLTRAECIAYSIQPWGYAGVCVDYDPDAPDYTLVLRGADGLIRAIRKHPDRAACEAMARSFRDGNPVDL
jgi:hypothetical protein